MNQWMRINQKEVENRFDKIFNPEMLWGYQAIVYDDALTRANNYGTHWKEEMEKDDVLFFFMCDCLEQEGITVSDFLMD